MTEDEKYSKQLLQEVDCNCSDCKFMIRDFDRFNESLKLHKKWQLDYFNLMVRKKRDAAWDYLFGKNGKSVDYDKYRQLLKESEKMKFQFDKSSCTINYGTCDKFKKPVSFIPNQCSIDTQDCFVHRKNV